MAASPRDGQGEGGNRIQLFGRNISGDEADQLGIISQAVPPDDLAHHTNKNAREIASRHLASLEQSKIGSWTLAETKE